LDYELDMIFAAIEISPSSDRSADDVDFVPVFDSICVDDIGTRRCEHLEVSLRELSFSVVFNA